MPIMYPNLAKVQEMTREQLLFLYRNLPTAENPREVEVIREISLMLGPNPVPELMKQAAHQLEQPTEHPFVHPPDKPKPSSFVESPKIHEYHRLDDKITVNASLVETRDKSVLLEFELNQIKYPMLKFKPNLRVFFPRTKVNQINSRTWEIDREILASNIKTAYSKFRDYSLSKYSKVLPEEVFLAGGLTL